MDINAPVIKDAHANIEIEINTIMYTTVNVNRIAYSKIQHEHEYATLRHFCHSYTNMYENIPLEFSTKDIYICMHL